MTQTEALKMALEALDQLTNAADTFSVSGVYFNEEVWAKKCLSDAYFAINAIEQTLAQQSNEQVDAQWQPIETAPFNANLLVRSKDCFISQDYRSRQYENTWTHWMPLPDTHPPVPTAQPDCTRSHPHEEMSKECELRTEIARLTSQQAHRSQAQLQLKMTALEKAWFHGYENDIESALRDLREEIINSTLAQLKEPEQEPAIFLKEWSDWRNMVVLNLMRHGGVDKDLARRLAHFYQDYAPQRKPLAYVDLRRVANQCGLGANEVSAQAQAKVDNFARAIEAAHGIKE